jgi:hypothetical protein
MYINHYCDTLKIVSLYAVNRMGSEDKLIGELFDTFQAPVVLTAADKREVSESLFYYTAEIDRLRFELITAHGTSGGSDSRWRVWAAAQGGHIGEMYSDLTNVEAARTNEYQRGVNNLLKTKQADAPAKTVPESSYPTYPNEPTVAVPEEDVPLNGPRATLLGFEPLAPEIRLLPSASVFALPVVPPGVNDTDAPGAHRVKWHAKGNGFNIHHSISVLGARPCPATCEELNCDYKVSDWASYDKHRVAHPDHKSKKAVATNTACWFRCRYPTGCDGEAKFKEFSQLNKHYWGVHELIFVFCPGCSGIFSNSHTCKRLMSPKDYKNKNWKPCPDCKRYFSDIAGHLERGVDEVCSGIRNGEIKVVGFPDS